MSWAVICDGCGEKIRDVTDHERQRLYPANGVHNDQWYLKAGDREFVMDLHGEDCLRLCWENYKALSR